MARGKTSFKSCLIRVLSAGAAFAYSGCFGSFSTKRLKKGMRGGGEGKRRRKRGKGGGREGREEGEKEGKEKRI